MPAASRDGSVRVRPEGQRHTKVDGRWMCTPPVAANGGCCDILCELASRHSTVPVDALAALTYPAEMWAVAAAAAVLDACGIAEVGDIKHDRD